MSVGRRLEELGARYGLTPDAVAALDRLLEIVRADPAAPTTVRDPAVAVDAHVADALVALELDRVRAARRIADLGAGAGFPGLVLAAALPEAEVALVEANGRKCAFLTAATEEMGLANVEVVAARAEAWPEGLGSRDVVTARAVAPAGGARRVRRAAARTRRRARRLEGPPRRGGGARRRGGRRRDRPRGGRGASGAAVSGPNICTCTST